nr:hypothetical protein [Escherichia coli]
MVKRNTGLVVGVRQNRLLKHWQAVALLMSFSSRNDSTALLFLWRALSFKNLHLHGISRCALVNSRVQSHPKKTLDFT